MGAIYMRFFNMLGGEATLMLVGSVIGLIYLMVSS